MSLEKGVTVKETGTSFLSSRGWFEKPIIGGFKMFVYNICMGRKEL